MAVDYNDQRLVQVEAQKNQALAEVNNTYNDMINKSDGYYQAQINASKEWADKQSQLQQEKTDFAIEKIEQQKDQAEKDYTREQSASYVDWQKESNRYGANAETMAQNGFVASGYGESSQVSMYNTYQNRVATARESYQRAVLNYDNAIKDAQLQNNSILAEIAYTSLQQQLELSLQGFQYKNTLISERLNTKHNVENAYHSRYMDVLGQINTENALAEQIRQFNAQQSLEQQQFNFEKQKYYDSQVSVVSGGSGGSGGGSTPKVTKQSDAKVVSGKKAVGIVADAKQYGTFSNGYQPKGIGDEGLVRKTGDTVTVNGRTQNLWRTDNGKLWVWDGSTKQYKNVGKEAKSTKGGGAGLGVAHTLIR
jgi:hypothetical protein